MRSISAASAVHPAPCDRVLDTDPADHLTTVIEAATLRIDAHARPVAPAARA
jgi:hypothetical protein